MSETVKVKVRVTLEYEIEAHKDYASKAHIEFRRNEGTYCWDNLVEELEALVEKQEAAGSCLCHLPKRPVFEVLEGPEPCLAQDQIASWARPCPSGKEGRFIYSRGPMKPQDGHKWISVPFAPYGRPT